MGASAELVAPLVNMLFAALREAAVDCVPLKFQIRERAEKVEPSPE